MSCSKLFLRPSTWKTMQLVSWIYTYRYYTNKYQMYCILNCNCLSVKSFAWQKMRCMQLSSIEKKKNSNIVNNNALTAANIVHKTWMEFSPTSHTMEHSTVFLKWWKPLNLQTYRHKNTIYPLRPFYYCLLQTIRKQDDILTGKVSQFFVMLVYNLNKLY